ncbi:MAG: ShlB/FhaC/HecB family hemolysin secretion/activation protein [Alphaproteobacteria bacterium]|nr:ShlB/FhaC/HecB family hemolysin secretion/activation protein [Alphaproteobacteria bacterium]
MAIKGRNPFCLILVILAMLHGAAAFAQDYRNVAPHTEPAPPLPSIAPAPPPHSTDQRQILPELKGLVFVDGLNGVQRGGITPQTALATDLPLLQDPGFLASVQPYLGQPLTFAKLDEITRAVIEQYRKNDRPLVDVIVPEQDIDNGIVQVAVTEFHVGAVRVEGNKWFSDDVLKRAVRVKPGEKVVGSELLTDIASLNDNPFRRVDLIYQRSAEIGASDIVLHTTDRLPLRVYTGFEDTGSRTLGINHVFAGFNWGNVFGLDHQFSYQVTASDDLLFGNPPNPDRPDKPRFLAHSASYVIPLPWHDRLTFFGAYAESVPRLIAANSTGISEQGSFRYGIPFARSETEFHEIQLGYDFKQSNNNFEFGGQQISASSADIHQVALEYSGRIADDAGSTEFTGNLYASPGNLTHANSDAAFQLGGAGRAGASANYIYGQLGAERLTNLPYALSWSVRGLVQRSSASLLASEQFGLGGARTVRGYDQYQVEGDNGWLLVNELRSPVFRLFSDAATGGLPDRFQLFGFIDLGHVASRTPQPSQQPLHATLSSIGLGLTYGIDRYLDIRLDYGWQLTRLDPLPGTTNPGSSSRGDIAVVLSF